MTLELLYTSSMDRVRLGRVLGFGARQAVKTLVTAVDAATADNPTARSAAKPAPAATARGSVDSSRARPAGEPAGRQADPARNAVQTAARTVGQAREVQKGLRRGTRQFGQAVWQPFVRLSGVLWLEVSGVFFGVFALVALGWGWKVRGAWHATANNAGDHRRFMSAVIMLALFGYFCVSNFVRARRRERGQ